MANAQHPQDAGEQRETGTGTDTGTALVPVSGAVSTSAALAAEPSGAGRALVQTQARGMAPAPTRGSSFFTYGEMMKLAPMLVESGMLPTSIKTPAAACAIMMTGAEMGIPPMQALRSIRLVEGTPQVAADLQLALFKRDGGRVKWHRLTTDVADGEFFHPNGDSARVEFTLADARRADLLDKKNWKRYPRPMLRSRCITEGLKSVGYEGTTGVYDPDEVEDFTTPATRSRFGVLSETRGDDPYEKPASLDGEAARRADVDLRDGETHAQHASRLSRERADAAKVVPFGDAPPKGVKGVRIDAVYPPGTTTTITGKPKDCGGYYIISDPHLDRLLAWCEKNDAAPDFAAAIRLEKQRRDREQESAGFDGPNGDGSDGNDERGLGETGDDTTSRPAGDAPAARAAAAPATTTRVLSVSTPDAIEHGCPKCGGRMWDNRATKRNPKAPDFKCRDRTCDGVIWPPKEGDRAHREPAEQADILSGAALDDASGQPPYGTDDIPF